MEDEEQSGPGYDPIAEEFATCVYSAGALLRASSCMQQTPKTSQMLLLLYLAMHSYEDYLDSQITGTDMYYLEDLELARQLVELG